MTAFVDKAMELARFYAYRDTEAVFASDTSQYKPVFKARDDALDALRLHLESHEALLRQALEAMERTTDWTPEGGTKERALGTIASLKQALEPK